MDRPFNLMSLKPICEVSIRLIVKKPGPFPQVQNLRFLPDILRGPATAQKFRSFTAAEDCLPPCYIKDDQAAGVFSCWSDWHS